MSLSAEVTAEIQLTPRMLAEWWCAFADEEQSQFFVEVAAIMATWSSTNREMQLYAIAKRLADCECSSKGAREVVAELASELTRGAGR